ncbi:MAG: hypothetical protein QXR58_02115 [Candidatus Micrarchaeaceae archaeon]
MANVLAYTAKAYASNLRVILLFSISLVIAFLIPTLAFFPTYNDMGAIFVRTASELLNLNAFTFSVIVVSVFFSLIFLSFAIVAINIIVKHGRTHVRIKKEVLEGLEKYTSRVFAVLLLFTLLLSIFNLAVYLLGLPAYLYYIIALALTPFFFYAPSSIVIDDLRIRRAFQMGTRFFFKRFDYFILWLAIAVVVLTFFDAIFIALSHTTLSGYVMLAFNAIFIVPFLVLLQSEMYMKRFAILKR